jgi:hypothetical protein
MPQFDRYRLRNGQLVDDLQTDPKGGGVGLTPTAADTAIFYDPWRNPAAESQAKDRTHRIGQTKKPDEKGLFVHRLPQRAPSRKGSWRCRRANRR